MKYFKSKRLLCHFPWLNISFNYLILSVTDAPSIQKNIASNAYPWFVFSPAFFIRDLNVDKVLASQKDTVPRDFLGLLTHYLPLKIIYSKMFLSFLK